MIHYENNPSQGAVLLLLDDNPTQQVHLMMEEEQPKQQVHLIPEQDPAKKPEKKTQPASKAEPLSEEDLLIEELMRERDQALEEAKKKEEKLAKQKFILDLKKQRDEAVEKAAQLDQELKASSNPPVKPQPTTQGPMPTSVTPQPAKPTAPPSAPSPATPKPSPASIPIPQASASVPVPRPLDIAIPEVARGYEDVYRRFLGGKLIYTDPTSKAKTELPIRALANPLEGTFNLSGCGDTGNYLSISTGYRKGVKAENSSKVEIWLAPWFLVNKNLTSTAKHLQPIMGSWDAAKAPVGLFWTWGGWSDLGWYDYLVTNSLDQVGSEDLLEKYKKSPSLASGIARVVFTGRKRGAHAFQVWFLN